MNPYLKKSAIAFDIDIFYNNINGYKNGLPSNYPVQEFLQGLKNNHYVIVMHWKDRTISSLARQLRNEKLVDQYILSPAYSETEDKSFASVPLEYNIQPENTLFIFNSYHSFKKAESEKLKNIRCLKVQEIDSLKDKFFDEKNEIHVDSRNSFEKMKAETRSFNRELKGKSAFLL